MTYCNTIFSRLLKPIPRQAFEQAANAYYTDGSFRQASRWSWLTAMRPARVSGRS
ncbi:MAG: DUF4372 domain-containing protein [Arenicellales bacterium WSBS_2016_MAG_OTU3]